MSHACWESEVLPPFSKEKKRKKKGNCDLCHSQRRLRASPLANKLRYILTARWPACCERQDYDTRIACRVIRWCFLTFSWWHGCHMAVFSPIPCGQFQGSVSRRWLVWLCAWTEVYRRCRAVPENFEACGRPASSQMGPKLKQQTDAQNCDCCLKAYLWTVCCIIFTLDKINWSKTVGGLFTSWLNILSPTW